MVPISLFCQKYFPAVSSTALAGIIFCPIRIPKPVYLLPFCASDRKRQITAMAAFMVNRSCLRNINKLLRIFSCSISFAPVSGPCLHAAAICHLKAGKSQNIYNRSDLVAKRPLLPPSIIEWSSFSFPILAITRSFRQAPFKAEAKVSISSGMPAS